MFCFKENVGHTYKESEAFEVPLQQMPVLLGTLLLLRGEGREVKA